MARPPEMSFIVHGNVIDPVNPHEFTYGSRTVLVGPDGVIAQNMADDAPHAARLRDDAARTKTLVTLSPTQVLLPGFVDLHIHAPQWPQAGKALDLPLEQWLTQRTFPLESRFADLEFATATYRDLVSCLLANGTTTAVYFATIDAAASLVLARECLARGQRAFVGLVAMDDPDLCPDYYRHASADTAIETTRRFIADVRALPGNERALVRPVITPRFIPACTDGLLEGLGRLAEQEDCIVQTHCSESDWAHQSVLSRQGCTDTQALDRFGLLREHTILAHGNMIDREDRALVARRGAAIAHCPISNAYFAGAVFPLCEALAEKLRVGLGTDISGGYSPSILDNARSAITNSRMMETGTDPGKPEAERASGKEARITFREAFWLATRGGAQACGVNAGCFQPGAEFDALLLERENPDSNLRVAQGESADDVLQQIICNATRANIQRTWVGGACVHQRG